MSKLPSPCQKCWNLPAKVNYKDKELPKRLIKSSQRSIELIGKHLFDLWD